MAWLPKRHLRGLDLEALHAKQKGEISWDKYIHTLFTRHAGIKHEEDNVRDTESYLHNNDPFGHMIWCWSNRSLKRSGPMKDTSSLEAVFLAYRYSTLDDVKEKLALLDDRNPKEAQKSLALLACQERRADVLKFCLDQGGFPIDATFYDEVENVDAVKDPEVFEVIQQSSQLQRIRESEERRRKLREEREQKRNFKEGMKVREKDEYGNPLPITVGAPPGAAATFDRGGKYPVIW